MTAIKLLICETHPVQYRAPLYCLLNQIRPGSFHVVYASDYSVRGGLDQEFGQAISWDNNLLSGYPYSILSTDCVRGPAHWYDLRAPGLSSIIRQLSPKAILLNSFNYYFDIAAYSLAVFNRIPLWARCETHDKAFPRSFPKECIRFLYYRALYAPICQAFPIGELNRRHWLKHGLHPSQLRSAPYCTPDPCFTLTSFSKSKRRNKLRTELGVKPDQLLVSFFGKLIRKKDPGLIFTAIPFLPPSFTQRLSLAFIGSGELADSLQLEASLAEERYSISSHFPGFVNQQALVDWYLATDIVVLPSRQAGETWGLVVNEALHAGACVVISDQVGCSADFANFERLRIIRQRDSGGLASALYGLGSYERDFDWAREYLSPYSLHQVALVLATAIDELQ